MNITRKLWMYGLRVLGLRAWSNRIKDLDEGKNSQGGITMSSDNIIKFRETGEEGRIIAETREKLGLNNDSVAIRILLRQGKKSIDAFLSHAWNVAQDMKYSEIDFLTSSLNVILKKRKKEEGQEIGQKQGQV